MRGQITLEGNGPCPYITFKGNGSIQLDGLASLKIGGQVQDFKMESFFTSSEGWKLILTEKYTGPRGFAEPDLLSGVPRPGYTGN